MWNNVAVLVDVLSMIAKAMKRGLMGVETHGSLIFNWLLIRDRDRNQLHNPAEHLLHQE